MSINMKEQSKSRNRSQSRPREQAHKSADEEWREDERDYLRKEWAKRQEEAPPKPTRPLPEPAQEQPPPKPPRQMEAVPPVRVMKNNTGPSSRPLPDPAAYVAPQTYSTPGHALPSRTERFLSSNPAPRQEKPQTTSASELGAFDSTAERDAEDRRRRESQAKTKAGGWASKSLLEREMEMERQRQKEWEEGQMAREAAKRSVGGLDGAGSGSTPGRRGIVGPRPPPAR
jgi:hypothetical protein